MPIPIVADPAAMLSRGNFGARFDGSRLLVPYVLNDLLLQNRLVTVEEFVSFAYSFPTALAMPLGWQPSDIAVAFATLTPLLRGAVAQDILIPPAPKKRGYGAENPATSWSNFTHCGCR